MTKQDPKMIFEWHKILEKFNSSGMHAKQFCKENSINYEKFYRMKLRLEHKRYTDPDLYEKLVKLGRSYLTSGIPAGVFSKNHNINILDLSSISTHLRYLDAVQEMKEKGNTGSMRLIEIPIVPFTKGGRSEPIEPTEPEVIKKQNSVELTITKGVKVVVSPEVGADKLLRIIELLKDL
jgi:hypothetical protein